MYCAVIKEDNMKKSLKKILAFTMAAAMAAGLAACGSSASTSPSAGGSGSAPAVSARALVHCCALLDRDDGVLRKLLLRSLRDADL